MHKELQFESLLLELFQPMVQPSPKGQFSINTKITNQHDLYWMVVYYGFIVYIPIYL